ncbi:hypothetical protein CDAR_247031 [Caerostris darwini]|uniref:Uncharacterized protein n=1 Tax=Caerostris darwini TaxID=1538125 RepID=A0AAV4SDF1_9ARAC|nr:hypothetical protein CDAR_247031 [Caerostris darwini]
MQKAFIVHLSSQLAPEKIWIAFYCHHSAKTNIFSCPQKEMILTKLLAEKVANGCYTLKTATTTHIGKHYCLSIMTA